MTASGTASTVDRQTVEFVRLGYAGASLDFRVKVASTEALWLCLYEIGSYGEFDPDAVGEAITGAAGWIDHIELGREYSPVLYLHLPRWTHHTMAARRQDEDEGEPIPEGTRETMAARLMRLGQELKADEVDVRLVPADAPGIGNSIICVRLWWD